MKIRWQAFNFYLACALGLALWVGCKTEKSEEKKILATLKVHQEIHIDPNGHSETVTVHRDPEIKMVIDKEAFLTGAAVKEAKVIDVLGGFALQFQFDRQGTWLLEEYTAASRGRHIAIFTQFESLSEKKLNAGRWLAAPLISNIITNGQLVFTPDATREEAEHIALGLNNVARMLETGKEPKF